MRRRSQRGSSLIEVAVLAPVMALLLLGTIWFGYAFYTYNQVEKAVHDAARYAATRTLMGNASGTNSFVSDTRNVAVYGVTSGSSYPVVPNLNTCSIRIEFDPPTAQSNTDPCGPPDPPATRPNAIRISVVNYQMPGMFGAISISKPITRFPYLGRFYRQTP